MTRDQARSIGPTARGAASDNHTYFAFAQSLERPRLAPKGQKQRRKKFRTRNKTLTEPAADTDLIAGRYRLERLLGAGGMGLVYRARDLLLEQHGDPEPYIALKMLSEELSKAPDANALLYGEFALTRRLNHPNVVRVFSFDLVPETRRAFMTLEWMPGLTLDHLLCERPCGLSEPELQGVALPLLDALAHSHGRGVLHGDLKPGNVMMGEEGVRLFDFGLGQTMQGILPGLPHLNRSRFDAWTPAYAAAELLEGSPLTPSSDLYAVACVLYELASGVHPYRRLPADQALTQQLHRPLQKPDVLPKHSWIALHEALALDSGRRRISVAELREAMNIGGVWRA